MICCLVIVTRQSRLPRALRAKGRTSLSFSPRPHSHFGTHPSPSKKKSPLSFHVLMGAHFATPLLSNSCRNGGYVPPSWTFGPADTWTCRLLPMVVCPLAATLMHHYPQVLLTKDLRKKLTLLAATLTKTGGYLRRAKSSSLWSPDVWTCRRSDLRTFRHV